MSSTDRDPPGDNHLPRLLNALGVGGPEPRWTLRELQAATDDEIHNTTWYRLARRLPSGVRPPIWSRGTLAVVALTLNKLGAKVSLDTLEQAAAADQGRECKPTRRVEQAPGYETLKSSGDPVDVVMSVITGLTDSELRGLLRDLPETLVDRLHRQITATVAERHHKGPGGSGNDGHDSRPPAVKC